MRLLRLRVRGGLLRTRGRLGLRWRCRLSLPGLLRRFHLFLLLGLLLFRLFGLLLFRLRSTLLLRLGTSLLGLRLIGLFLLVPLLIVLFVALRIGRRRHPQEQNYRRRAD